MRLEQGAAAWYSTGVQNDRSLAWGPGTTHWSKLLEPGLPDEPWRYFFDHYRDAVLALFRRSGVRVDEVEDLTQEFFAMALQRDFLARADPERGRFRGYLCAAARRFLASEWRRRARHKRDPGTLVALDTALGAVLPDDGQSPEDEFDLAWARGVLARAVARAQQDVAREGKPEHARAFELRQAGARWEDVARELATTPGAARGWVSRYEARVASYVRGEVATTVGSEAELEDELRALAEILSRG